jgi:hypothetical protein
MYVGREPRGPSKRFVMSTAKEIVIVEHSEEHSLNESKKAGSNGSGNPTDTPAVGAECPAAVRRRLADERHSLTHHFSVGGQEGYVTVGLYGARPFPGSWILSQQQCPWRYSTASHCGSCATSSATHGLSRAGGRAIQRLATPSHLWIM